MEALTKQRQQLWSASVKFLEEMTSFGNLKGF